MLTNSTTQKACQQCNKTIRGRSDKKFCNDYCRNSYNNVLKSPSNNLVRNINNQLSKNRRILESHLLPTEQFQKVKKQQLQEDGFLFTYFTHQTINKKGSRYFYCYDFGYLFLDEDWCLIIKNK